MKRILLPVAAILVVAATSCKPTENNYKQAYDAAQNKRQAAAAADAELGIPGGKLQNIDGPQVKVVNGDTIAWMKSHVKFTGGMENELRKWSVAVAAYKMPTNCAAQVSRLFTDGYKAFSVETPQGLFYVVAGSFDNLDEAAVFAKEYAAKHKPAEFIGLDGAALLIEK